MSKIDNNKVGILNFQYSDHNYGAVLQAAALEFTLKELGYDATHIDFQPKTKKTLRSRFGKVLKIFKSDSLKINNKEAFERFRNNYISRTKRINSSNQFYKLAKEFDSIIVGSDQVWRPRMSSDIIAFFLGYVPDTVTRVSYAASFGASEWELSEKSELTQKIRKELEKFKAVSCRESSGVEICKNTFGINSIHVLDPLLLVDSSFYNVFISNKVKNSSRIVYYKLDIDHFFIDTLDRLEKVYGEKPRNIYLKESSKPEYEEVTNWVNYLYNSSIIITDSFHCICLGLLFNKEIIYYPNPKRGEARLDSLFSMLNVSLHSISSDSSIPLYRLETDDNINKYLQGKRIDDISFIRNALS